MLNDVEICVFGAGSIGCYVGGRLAASRARVTLVARPRIAEEIATNGLHLTDLHGSDLRALPAQIRVETAPVHADRADLVLVTVKSADTAEAARILQPLLRRGTVVISIQNGISNADVLRGGLPDCVVVPGIATFNVLPRGNGHFHQGTEGELIAQDDPELERFAVPFRNAGLPLLRRADLVPTQWGKLLLNLNNPINALSNVPLLEELSQRSYRRCLALAQGEALEVMKRADIRPTQLIGVPPGVMVKMLGAPSVVFKRVAGKVLAVDPVARSSMWEDLERGRITEIDYLSGEIVRLAEKVGTTAPVNARLTALIKVAESGGRREWTGKELLRTLLAARDADNANTAV
ncbi:2-dehydropantoate 2-reductase [Antrihabitans sp. YC2-6]|uniref:2-dehydropantoate 2-reductase n=1 Tax=Antrihabitans sp. YC2-6 TaxID=2799498 RepID=UPI0018F5691C|nr:2-dehydropantoate 2-reductase [Antrihabitans sp. YC2-6]MBJ8345589.1 2-dehydropantoate 2-reductase [Antrihabitans sp. YC2-6]